MGLLCGSLSVEHHWSSTRWQALLFLQISVLLAWRVFLIVLCKFLIQSHNVAPKPHLLWPCLSKCFWAALFDQLLTAIYSCLFLFTSRQMQNLAGTHTSQCKTSVFFTQFYWTSNLHIHHFSVVVIDLLSTPVCHQIIRTARIPVMKLACTNV